MIPALQTSQTISRQPVRLAAPARSSQLVPPDRSECHATSASPSPPDARPSSTRHPQGRPRGGHEGILGYVLFWRGGRKSRTVDQSRCVAHTNWRTSLHRRLEIYMYFPNLGKNAFVRIGDFSRGVFRFAHSPETVCQAHGGCSFTCARAAALTCADAQRRCRQCLASGHRSGRGGHDWPRLSGKHAKSITQTHMHSSWLLSNGARSWQAFGPDRRVPIVI